MTALKRVGLLGWPVDHSLSPAMHNAAFEALGLSLRYELLPVHAEEFEARTKKLPGEGFVGWNVTFPHKQAMARLLDTAGPEVLATGACNTVLMEDGKQAGFNTDPDGFLMGLEEAGGIPAASAVVLLGAGGAARAVAWALASAGHPVELFARRVEQAESLCAHLRPFVSSPLAAHALQADTIRSSLSDAALLVNCTSAGMPSNANGCPLPSGVALDPRLLVYDIVYGADPTPLLREAHLAGCRTQDGLTMLVGQGAAAFRIWTGRNAPFSLMLDTCKQTLLARSTAGYAELTKAIPDSKE